MTHTFPPQRSSDLLSHEVLRVRHQRCRRVRADRLVFFQTIQAGPERLGVLEGQGVLRRLPEPSFELLALGQRAVRRHQTGMPALGNVRSEEHTSELQSLMRISYAVFRLKNK